MEAVENLGLAQESGDAAKIAAAKKAVADIQAEMAAAKAKAGG
jgi:phosphonate transport system substrate-binding protein